jgi:hypothetical protein
MLRPFVLEALFRLIRRSHHERAHQDHNRLRRERALSVLGDEALAKEFSALEGCCQFRVNAAVLR